MKNFKLALGVLLGAALSIAIPVFGASVSVPSAPTGVFNYLLQSTTTGNWVASKDLTVVGTSTLATTTTSVLNGVIVVDGVHYAQNATGIQSAINTCIALGSLCGEVHIPAGIYTLTAELYYNGNNTNKGVHLVISGDGIDSTILRLGAGVASGTAGNNYQGVFQGRPNQTNGGFQNPDADASGIFTLKNVTLDYNGANQTFGASSAAVPFCIFLDGTRFIQTLIQNVKCTNAFVPTFSRPSIKYGIALDTGGALNATLDNFQSVNSDEGIWITAVDAGETPANTLLNTKILGGNIASTTDAAIYYEFGGNVTIDNVTIATSSYGVYGLTLDSGYDVKATINKLRLSNITNYGIYIQGNHSTVSNNTIDGTGLYAIAVVGSSNTISTNTVKNVGSGNSTILESGILIAGNSNTVLGNALDTIGQHGISLQNATSTIVFGNAIQNASWGLTNTYAGISVQGGGTNIISNNEIVSSTTPAIAYGVSLNNTSYQNSLNNNQVTGAVTSDVNDSGIQTSVISQRNGRVGIGTSNPTVLFDVANATGYATLKLRGQNSAMAFLGGGSGDGNNYIESANTSFGSNAPLFITGVNATRGSNLVISFANVGIGTSSPYAMLSVTGQTVAEYFTSTSTINASTFPYASTTALTISGNGFVSNLLVTGSTTLGNFYGLNSTTTNATSTTSFATTASSTNSWTGTLTAAQVTLTQAGAVGSPSVNLGSNVGLYRSATTLSLTNGTNGLSFDGTTFFPNTDNARFLGKLANRWAGFYTLLATSTSATSTNFSTSNASTTNLWVDSAGGGTAGCATFSAAGLISNTGSACGGTSFGEAWQFFSSKGWLAPSTTVGIIVNASSTIGDSTQTGGLSISGGATTSLNSYFASNIGIGTTSPYERLSLSGVEVAAGTPLQILNTVSKGQADGGPILEFAHGGQRTASIKSASGSGNSNPYLSLLVSPNTTAPVEVARFNKSGFFGVGTTTPLSTLVVSNNASIGADYNFAAPSNGLIIEGFTGIGTTSPYRKLSIVDTEVSGGTPITVFDTKTKGQADGGPLISFSHGGQPVSFIFTTSGSGNSNPYMSFGVSKDSASPIERMRITEDGYLGLGTTSPGTTLGVTGNGLFTGELTAPFFTATRTNATSSFAGLIGVGSTTPWATLAVNPSANIASNQFVVGSSTATNFRIDNSGFIYAPNTASSGASQTGYWCYDANGQFIRDTTTCLVSALKFKKDINNLPDTKALSAVLAMQPVTYYEKNPLGKDSAHQQVGFIADYSKDIVPDLIVHDNKGEIRGFNYEQYTAYLTGAVREQQKEIDALKAGKTQNKSAQDLTQWTAILLLFAVVTFQLYAKRK